MVQPQKPPISIRLGDERLARIDAYAADHKLSRHLAILLLLDEGYRSLTCTIETPLSGVVVELEAVAKPAGVQKGVVTTPMHLPRAAYGTRLKKPKGK